jgi:antirestriction protein ArdC
VAYIQSWLGALRHDKTLAMQAAGRAQKAADFILLRPAGYAATSEEVAA